ncbi:replication initiation protein [Chondrinema litorale]|uniref:replication initiation protein n=1 Tax=Chondrinema litorale TaxID=2994555 RepID=UPI0025435CB7|nr:replication initiation protein [Chondrinema litorale]UZR98185.1 replication initiation protein [Chondrinema litorale]
MQMSIVEHSAARRQPAVIKANSLIEAKYKLSAREQKVLLFLISKLDSKSSNPGYVYQTHVDEIMQVLKDSGIKWGDAYTCFTEIIMLLKSKPISIHSDGELIMANWLGTVSLVEKSGVVKFSFDSLIAPFIFEIKKNFTKYPLRHVIKLRSTYSIRIYELLKQYARIGERKFDLMELRQVLGIEDDLYPRFFDFKKRVIEPAQKEIAEHTDIEFTFKKIKHKRTIVGIYFKIIFSDDSAASYYENGAQEVSNDSPTPQQENINKPSETKAKFSDKTDREKRLIERLEELKLDDWQIERIMTEVGAAAETGIWKLVNEIKMDNRDGRVKSNLGAYAAKRFDQFFALGFFD